MVYLKRPVLSQGLAAVQQTLSPKYGQTHQSLVLQTGMQFPLTEGCFLILNDA